MLQRQGTMFSRLLNRGTGRIHHLGLNSLTRPNCVQTVSDHPRKFQSESSPPLNGLPNYPTQQQLDFYKGWNTANLVKWMRELGYGVTLNVPKNLLSVKLETGIIDFSFSPQSAMVNHVQFTPETSTNS